MERVLIGLGFEDELAYKTMSPFHELHTKLKGHKWGSDAESIRKNALMDHGSFKKHFSVICGNCDESLNILIQCLKNYI